MCIYLGTFPRWFGSHSLRSALLLPIAPRTPRFHGAGEHHNERQTVRIAIIGTGKMGRGFAQALAPTHQVIVGSRDPDRAAPTAVKTGATGGATYPAAAATADVVMLTVPWNAMNQTLGQLGNLTGAVVIDVSYPYTKREREALTGTSTAEAIQQRLPGARVCKGWNHVHARHLTLLMGGEDLSVPRSCQTRTC